MAVPAMIPPRVLPRVVLLVAAVGGESLARANPEPMTRGEIIDLAASAVGISYWWGHARWRADGAESGQCVGTCPDCAHQGSYGADCSGLVSKAWQVPSPTALDVDTHPYSTESFRFGRDHWSQIEREALQAGDALVYRSADNTAGHIVLYERADAWGTPWIYECRGCATGCLHAVVPIPSTYVAIRRERLMELPTTGVLQGVVFVDRGTGRTELRLPGATVEISGVGTVTARDEDAVWEITAAVGSYEVTARATGFSPAQRQCAVAAEAVSWCAIGLRAVPERDGGEVRDSGEERERGEEHDRGEERATPRLERYSLGEGGCADHPPPRAPLWAGVVLLARRARGSRF